LLGLLKTELTLKASKKPPSKNEKIMSKFISINPASEVAATLTQHPDYELFSRLSSVENFATRQYGTGG
jgi:hypothetical protein